jgi:hypothetical protein
MTGSGWKAAVLTIKNQAPPPGTLKEEDPMTEFDHKLRLATALAGKTEVSRRRFIQLPDVARAACASANAIFPENGPGEPKRGGAVNFGHKSQWRKR